MAMLVVVYSSEGKPLGAVEIRRRLRDTTGTPMVYDVFMRMPHPRSDEETHIGTVLHRYLDGWKPLVAKAMGLVAKT